MSSFSDFNVWGSIMIFVALLGSLLVGNMLKKGLPFLRNSLIPTSVIGGLILLLIAGIYKWITGNVFFDESIFGGSGMQTLEKITYHTLALGFIASTLKKTGKKLTKQRSVEVFNTGVTTVATYLLQGVFGLGITLIIALIVSGFFPAAGVLLPFGYGQGSGQAMNFGGVYEALGFVNGKSFGLAVAALGFLSAALGGVVHLNIRKKRGRLAPAGKDRYNTESVESPGEIPMQESVDKMTVQFALIAVSYALAFLVMFALGKLLPGMSATIYGFNFLLGVLAASLVKFVMNLLRKANLVKKEYTNNFLLTRVSNFFFDIMVVAGIAAIQLEALKQYWGALLILGVVGLVITYLYNRLVAKVLFPEYMEEQFLAMYGMLTGTASTGVILLREIDGDFRTPASENLVYQNFPAIVFGFPMMFLATLAPRKPILTLIIFILFFLAMNIILFRSLIFRRKKKKK